MPKPNRADFLLFMRYLTSMNKKTRSNRCTIFPPCLRAFLFIFFLGMTSSTFIACEDCAGMIGPPSANACDGVSCNDNEECIVSGDSALCECATGFSDCNGICIPDADSCTSRDGGVTGDGGTVCDPGTITCVDSDTASICEAGPPPFETTVECEGECIR